MSTLSAAVITALHEARTAEKAQALFYRALAAAAEEQHDADLSERLNGLHADEQHHLSRLTVRLVELQQAVVDLGSMRAPVVSIGDWEDEARERERIEVERYEALLRAELDERTRAVIEQFVVAERSHMAALGGKWMGAEP